LDGPTWMLPRSDGHELYTFKTCLTLRQIQRHQDFVSIHNQFGHYGL